MNAKFLGGITLAVLVPVTAAWAGDHSHSHAASEAAAVQSGAKMATDAVLRQGMADIRAVMVDGLAKRPAAADYARLGDAVEAHIDRITQNCKLPADADARLHVVLARMIDGVERLRGTEKQPAGAAMILGALDEYGRGFDHPGWVPVGH